MAILLRTVAVAAAMVAGGTIAGEIAWFWGAEENVWATAVLVGIAGGLVLAVALLVCYARLREQSVQTSVLAGAAGALTLGAIFLLLFLGR